jgi:hypothetical protein
MHSFAVDGRKALAMFGVFFPDEAALSVHVRNFLPFFERCVRRVDLLRNIYDSLFFRRRFSLAAHPGDGYDFISCAPCRLSVWRGDYYIDIEPHVLFGRRWL